LQGSTSDKLAKGLGESAAEGEGEEDEKGGDVGVAPPENISDASEYHGATKITKCVRERDPSDFLESVEVYTDGV